VRSGRWIYPGATETRPTTVTLPDGLRKPAVGRANPPSVSPFQRTLSLGAGHLVGPCDQDHCPIEPSRCFQNARLCAQLRALLLPQCFQEFLERGVL
jgi:hypothetical protein